jgi:predicted nucleotidyltransferase
MRITEEERQKIKEIIAQQDSSAEVILFGSRTDDQAKGGDIDLFVLSSKISFAEQIQLKLRLYDQLGEQKIDLIVTPEARNSFQEMVLEKGVRL